MDAYAPRYRLPDLSDLKKLSLLAFGICLVAAGCRTPAGRYRPATAFEGQPGSAGRFSSPARATVARRPAARAVEQTVPLGESVQGRPIEMTVFGQDGETTLILGAFHGNEGTSADVAHQIIAFMRADPAIYQGQRVAVVPVVNPDGLIRQVRTNAHDVDLNRNFPASNYPDPPPRRFAGGPFAASERETQAIMAAVRKLAPAKIISIHSIERGHHGNNFDGPAQSLALEMSRHNGYAVLPTMGYVTPGSFGTWAGIDQQIPTITLELPRDASGSTCWRENRDALLAAIRFPTPSRTGHAAYRVSTGK